MASFSESSKHGKKQAKSRSRLAAHIGKLLKNKIDVTPERWNYLQSLQPQSNSITHDTSAPNLLVLNFSGWKSSLDTFLGSAYVIHEPDAVFEDIHYIKWILKSRETSPPSTSIRVEEASSQRSATTHIDTAEARCHGAQECPQDSILRTQSDSWSNIPDAVVVLTGPTLTVFQELVVGTTFLKGKPVVVLAEGASEDTCREVQELTAGTWPVFNDSHSLLEFLVSELPAKIRFRALIHEDIQRLLEKHKDVNLTGVAVSRGAVAFIPFGVHTINTVTLMKLCRQCMMDTGMGADKEARKAMAKGGGAAGAFEFACNSASDVYQVLVQGSIMADMLAASSVSGALATLSAADVFLLGSISVVTGAVAAYTAYKTRPQLVDSVADTLVMLQFTYAMNESLRRTPQLK